MVMAEASKVFAATTSLNVSFSMPGSISSEKFVRSGRVTSGEKPNAFRGPVFSIPLPDVSKTASADTRIKVLLISETKFGVSLTAAASASLSSISTIMEASCVPLITRPACKVMLMLGVEAAESSVNLVKLTVSSMTGSLKRSSTVFWSISISNCCSSGGVVSLVTPLACKASVDKIALTGFCAVSLTAPVFTDRNVSLGEVAKLLCFNWLRSAVIRVILTLSDPSADGVLPPVNRYISVGLNVELTP